jgi:hypothetical protein
MALREQKERETIRPTEKRYYTGLRDNSSDGAHRSPPAIN